MLSMHLLGEVKALNLLYLSGKYGEYIENRSSRKNQILKYYDKEFTDSENTKGGWPEKLNQTDQAC